MTEFDEMLSPEVLYQGRLWDAPFTDHAMPADLTAEECAWCPEPIRPDDDAIKLPHISAHLECHLRAALGGVRHLEGRCSCYRASPQAQPEPEDDPHLSLRDDARATLHWLIDHNRGRFK